MTRAGLQLLILALSVPAIGAAAAGLSLPWVIAAAWAGVVAFGCGVIAMGPYGR